MSKAANKRRRYAMDKAPAPKRYSQRERDEFATGYSDPQLVRDALAVGIAEAAWSGDWARFLRCPERAPNNPDSSVYPSPSPLSIP